MEASNTVCHVHDWSRSNFAELLACWECVYTIWNNTQLPSLPKCPLQNSEGSTCPTCPPCIQEWKAVVFGFSIFHSSLLAVDSSLLTRLKNLLVFFPERHPVKLPDVEFMSSSISLNGSWRDILARSTLGSTVGPMPRLVAPVLNVGYMFDAKHSKSWYMETWAQSWSHYALRVPSARKQVDFYVWMKKKTVWQSIIISVARGFWHCIEYHDDEWWCWTGLLNIESNADKMAPQRASTTKSWPKLLMGRKKSTSKNHVAVPALEGKKTWRKKHQ